MKAVSAVIVRLMNRLQARFRGARAGSVLILVVALLVLMALLGTAFISTARIDRYGAAQNAANTEIDLLIEGVKSMVLSAIIDDLRDAAGNYRPPNQPEMPPTNYEHHDHPLVDLHLAARVPINNAASPVWRTISWPLIANGATVGTYQFDNPGAAPSIMLPRAAGGPPLPPAKGNFFFVPSFATFGGDPNWPHLRVFLSGTEQDTDPNTAGTQPLPAADVDGDGIADAGLWRLPMSPIDGITYYVATRIVDNNSAWNGSIAWAPSPGTDPSDIPNNVFFPTEVDLQRMLTGTDPQKAAGMAQLNTYRTGDATAVPLDPVADGAPTSQTPTARADFDFINARDAMQQALGRRLEYPGYKTPAGVRYQSVPLSASAALAYRFCLNNQFASPTVFEQLLMAPSYRGTTVKSAPYAASAFTAWFTDNFDYANNANPPLRALTVARNPVANARPSHAFNRGFYDTAQGYAFGDWVLGSNGRAYVCIQPQAAGAAVDPVVAPVPPALPSWRAVPWTDQPLKASINTAEFGELWHAFWDVMIETPAAAPWVPPNPPPLTGQFRNASRDASIIDPLVLNNYQMLLLRSAIAAVNAMDLRDSDNDVTSRNITLHLDPDNPAATHNVTVFGTERQPYITEVLVDTGTWGGIPGYVAIELHNPYPYPIPLTNWRLVATDRSPTAIRPRPIVDLLPGTNLGALVAMIPPNLPSIPANGYVVLESATLPAQRPPDVSGDLTARSITPVSAPGLLLGFNQEICLLRPRFANGVPSAAGHADNSYDEGSDLAPIFGNLVPVDQIDLTFLLPSAVGGDRWVYRRASNPAPVAPGPPDGTEWHFTNAGPYVFVPPAGTPRHTGMVNVPGDFGHLGEADHYAGAAPLNEAATFPTLPVQLANVDFGGPHKTVNPLDETANGVPHHFPFGAFARNGDMLQVPFIGAYKILLAGDDPNAVREWNSVPMDSIYADDGPTNTANNPNPSTDAGLVAEAREQVGRFCPVGNPRTGTGDYNADPAAGPWTYQWAMDLFDHLTVQAPHDDYLPDVDPAVPDPALEAPPPLPKYPVAPAPVANATYTVANDSDSDPADPVISEGSKVPVEGLININTASWKVLEAIPLRLDDATGAVNAGLNRTLWQQIVNYRDGVTTGTPTPFRTIYDLYKVTEFADEQDRILGLAAEPNDAQGDISPLGVAAASVDGVRYDFEERFLLLNRISNLITTRSDSYTCYLVVQGWQDAGTANPTLRTQRRLAFIVDRSRIVPTNAQATITPVPNN